ncbi:subtilisin-like protease [Colletotrichum chrysophilum]|uniref:Subtilisin-like protease n=1 Tax=Colletotrichum chrysophilum TaxID=1836956 RepID=A0AAD9A3D4_9PEZI|nr:subtilisin-like protease [Colletotrichum chrysophilum]
MYRFQSVTLFLALVSVCYSQTSEPAPSAVPSGTSADYIIYAKEGTNKADGDGFGNTLAGLVGEENRDIIANDIGIPFVWRANLTPDQLATVKGDRVVAEADINNPLTRDDWEPDRVQPSATQQKRAEVTQIPIAKNNIFDLRTLSTPPREKESLPNYRYDDVAGQGITVYVVDTGPFDLQHEELRSSDASITRRELDLARGKELDLQDRQYGTCIASKTVGDTSGAAKRASLVGVRIDFTEFGLLRGLQAAADEIRGKGLQGKAVISVSILTTAPSAAYTTSMRSIIQSLIKLDVPVVTGAGNKFQDGIEEPHKLPAVLAKELPVIVVGSADKDFGISAFSQRGNLVTTYAIGADVMCAESLEATSLATHSGTSFATPQIAGMLAYWMSHPDFARDLSAGSIAEILRNMTGALSYPRVAEAGYPPIAWNGYDLAESCSDSGSGSTNGRRAKRAMRRDLNQACAYAPKPVASAAPTATAVNPPVSAADGPTTTTTSLTETATAAPGTCNLCGAMLDSENASNLGGQVDCDGAEYAQSSCEANPDCKSWAYGSDNSGTYAVPVCLLFTQSATEIVSQAPPDPEGKCPFRYHDKSCPAP